MRITRCRAGSGTSSASFDVCGWPAKCCSGFARTASRSRQGYGAAHRTARLFGKPRRFLRSCESCTIRPTRACTFTGILSTIRMTARRRPAKPGRDCGPWRTGRLPSRILGRNSSAGPSSWRTNGCCDRIGTVQQVVAPRARERRYCKASSFAAIVRRQARGDAGKALQAAGVALGPAVRVAHNNHART